MGIYAVILIVAATFGLTKVWKYAEEYEAAQPSGAMDQYVSELNDKLWGAGIADTIAAMPHEVQTDEEVAEYVAAQTKTDYDSVYNQRGDADWLTGAEVAAGAADGTIEAYYKLQQDNFIASGAVEGEVPVADYVMLDNMIEAGK